MRRSGRLLALCAALQAAPGASLAQTKVDSGGAELARLAATVQQAYLKASNSAAFDSFGWSVAISGDTAVVGAPGEDSAATGVNGDETNDGATDSGAVYVFVRTGASWSQQAYLKAFNTRPGASFGFAVAVSGDTLVVGAQKDDSDSSGASANLGLSGAAYVFVRTGTSWTQQAFLKASNAQGWDLFGFSVAVSGDTVVVGAPGEDSGATGVNGVQMDESRANSGAAYVFRRSGTTWVQEAYLKASNTGAADAFAQALALSDDTVVVGAPAEDSSAGGVNGSQGSNASPGAGAAYVFVRGESGWSQQAYLKASSPDFDDRFGQSVASSGDSVLIGAYHEDSAATGVDGDPDDEGSFDSGAAYLFVRAGTRWAQQAYLKASNTGTLDEFGWSLGLSGDIAIVGAHLEDSDAIGPYGSEDNDRAPNSGAGYLFVRRGTAWEQQSYLKASNTETDDRFGRSVAIAGDTTLMGANLEAGSSVGVNGNQASNAAPISGAAYAFEVCSLSAVVFRNAGTNPASYAASAAVLGGTFTATVDNVLARQQRSLLFAFDAPTSLPLAGGQTLLCVDLGSGELFTGGNLYPASSAGGVDGYTLAVPNLPQLQGVEIHTQALQFGNPPFVLSNAQDVTLASF